MIGIALMQKGEPMADMMTFPDTVEEFMEQYKIVDTDQVYTNGVEMVPIFRMEQWFEHLAMVRTQMSVPDCISRQAVIDAICTWDKFGVDERGRVVRWYERLEPYVHLRDVVMAIEKLPSAQPEQRWIPCSKRLPEEYGEYRITWITSASGKRLIGDAEFEVTSVWDNEHDRFKGEWLLADYIKCYPDVKVLAWKPLEDPWRGKEDDRA